MKKYVIAEIGLVFSFTLFIYLFITHIQAAISYINYPPNPNFDYLEPYSQLGRNCIIIACLCAIAALFNLFVFLLILKNFKPLVQNHITIKTEERDKRLQSKTEKAEAKKQAKIKALEAELEELKRD